MQGEITQLKAKYSELMSDRIKHRSNAQTPERKMQGSPSNYSSTKKGNNLDLSNVSANSVKV